MVQPVQMGGLKMIAVDEMIKAVKIMWIKRLNNAIFAKWKTLSWVLLGVTKSELFSKIGYENLKSTPKILVYKQILNIWYETISVPPSSKTK